MRRHRILLNQDGNMMVIVLMLAAIGGGIATLMKRMDNTQSAVGFLRTLSNKQVLKGELQSNINRLILGQASHCHHSSLKTRMEKFRVMDPSASFSDVSFQAQIAAGQNPFHNPLVSCLLDEGKFKELPIKSLGIESKLSSRPNAVSLRSEVSSTVSLAIQGEGVNYNLDFKVQTSVSVLSMQSYGVIFTNYTAGRELISLSGRDVEVNVDGKVIVDSNGTRPRMRDLISLSNANKGLKLRYKKPFYLNASGLRANASNDDQFAELSHAYQESALGGSYANAFSGIDLPWRSQPLKYREDYWYDFLLEHGRILPKSSFGTSAIQTGETDFLLFGKSLTGSTVGNWSNNSRDTKKLFNRIKTAKSVHETCRQREGSRFYHMVFNHLNKDFTIDFSENNDVDNPPVFCGLVAARNLKIILNKSHLDELKTNIILGKFLISGQIEVVGDSRELKILDVLDFGVSDVNLSLPAQVKLELLPEQFLMQKYYLGQNFFLPLFKSAHSGISPYFLPREASAFMSRFCGSYWCVATTITSPEPKQILDHQGYFKYEVQNIY